MLYYFPAFWLLSILFYVLFFFKLRKNETTHKIYVEKYPYSKFPDIKKIKSIIRNTDDKKVV